MYANLAMMAAIVFVYSSVSGKLERTSISGALVFTAVGVILGTIVFGFGVGLLLFDGLGLFEIAIIVLGEHLPGGDTITVTVVVTIILSVLGHGLSASPLIAALAARLKRSPAKTAAGG